MRTFPGFGQRTIPMNAPNDQGAAPAAPPAPDPSNGGAPPAEAPDAGNLDAGLADTGLAMFEDTSPDSMIDDFIAGGLALDDPPQNQPGAPQPPTPQAPNAAPGTPGAPPAAPNGQQPQAPAPAPGGPDPLLARMFAGTTPPVVPQQPGGFAPSLAATQSHVPQQPAPQQPTQPEQLFNGPVPLPPQFAVALEHEDPQVRLQAMGAVIAAAGNQIYAAMSQRVEQQVVQAQARVTQQVSEQQFVRQVDTDLFGSFPHLRYANPALIQQAAQVVVNDELGRNPQAGYSPALMQRIGTLATQAQQAVMSGQMPNFQPPPPPVPQYQQPPQQQQWQQPPYLPPQYQQPPQGYPPQPQGYPPQQPPAYWSGNSAQPFGQPPMPMPTPESELASFFNGGWDS